MHNMGNCNMGKNSAKSWGNVREFHGSCRLGVVTKDGVLKAMALDSKHLEDNLALALASSVVC